jgi:dTMP kinase
MIILPNFAVLEGGDGTGTSTQLGLLKKRLGDGLYPTAEPCAGPMGGIIRSALRGEISLRPETLARLFAADRNEHLYGPGGVVERCGRGELVVSDRYVPSSLVYQGIECGDELPETLNASFPAPELLLFFDLDPEIAWKRMETRPFKDRYEYPDFQALVRRRYRNLLPRYEDAGVRVVSIDASLAPPDVAEQVWRALEKMPILGK